jgi:hypothetical protein
MILFLLMLMSFTGSSIMEVEHDIHISKCDIKHDTEESSLQITIHIYIDDLEESIESGGYDRLYILTERESEEADRLIEEYINTHLIMAVDGKEVQPFYLGKELSDDLMAAWCYLEVPDVASIDELDITYNALMELYDDQRNIVTVKQDKERKAYLLFDIKDFSDTVVMR